MEWQWSTMTTQWHLICLSSALDNFLLVKVFHSHLQVAHLLVEVVQVVFLLLELMRQDRNKKIHSVLLCGSSMSDLIVNNPSAVSISLHNGNIIAVDDNNETRAICLCAFGSPLCFLFWIQTQ